MKDWEQVNDARAIANKRRVAISEMRRHVLAGRVDVSTLILDPPECLLHIALVDLMAFAWTTQRSGVWREELGRAALKAGVNLLMPVGKASESSRRWAARNARSVTPSVAERRRAREAKARVVA